MPSQLEYVQAQAMQLTPAERNQLLERLITSLDSDLEVEAAWEQLADQREADIAAGRSHWIPGDEAMRQLSARLTP
ncbi:MAG: addiction module protein [Rhodoferax sp.]|nr:addiction module protein [Rhodoferax sp.]